MSIWKYLQESLSSTKVVAYHGTNQDFDSFTHDVKGITKKGYTSDRGFWFTTSKEEAEQYARYSDSINISNSEDHEDMIQSYLDRIEKAEKSRNWDLAEKLTAEMEEYEGNVSDDYMVVYTVNLSLENPFVYSGDIDGGKQDSIIKNALSKGHDSVIFKNIKDSPYGLEDSTTHIVVFDSKNIKIIDKEEL